MRKYKHRIKLKANKMANILQRIFYSPAKCRVIDAIKRNADKIKYEYYYSDDEDIVRYKFTISTPEISLTSLSEWPMCNFIPCRTGFWFKQSTPDTITPHLCNREHCAFSKKVYNKMSKAFIKRNGIQTLFQTQADFFYNKNQTQR